MTISRMQQPRQMYGLGSLVKSVTKGVKSAVKGITGAVKDNPLLAAAALNFAPMAFGAKPFIGMGSGQFNIPGVSGITDIFTKKASEKTLGDTLKVFAGGSLLGGLLSQAEQEGDPEGITRNVGALKLKLADAYRNQRTFADAEDEEAAIAKQVELDTAEYNQDMNRGVLATGGRIGYNEGTDFQKWLEGKQKFEQGLNAEQLYREYLEDKRRQKVAEQKTMAANGGRIGYALGTPEQNAIKAAGIEGLFLNQNPAGVKELDLRETGGFIPPVGVKEKADDIPAMLSNNEFVFTAKSVKEMGDGDVNRGAQRMYDMMKYLEKGGRV
jgi:hypothetical protein